jgi:multiple sugar transport system substrate-binding protein
LINYPTKIHIQSKYIQKETKMSVKLTRRDFLRSTSFVAAGSVLAACAPQVIPTKAPDAVEPTQAAKEVVNITYWHGWAVDTEKKAMEDAVKLFNDSHPYIQVEPTSGKTNDMVLTAVSGGNPPDAWSLWSTQTLSEWASKGVISDLNDQVTATIDTTQFTKGALDVSMYKGKYYGLPIEVDPLSFITTRVCSKKPALTPRIPQKPWRISIALLSN